MAISFEVNVKDNFTATMAKFEAQAKGLGASLEGVDSKALLAQNRILSALEKQAKARKDTGLVAALQGAQKGNLLEASKSVAQDAAARDAAKAAKVQLAIDKQRKKEASDSAIQETMAAKNMQAVDRQRKKDRIEGEKAAAKQFEVNRAVKGGAKGGKLLDHESKRGQCGGVGV